MTRLDPAEITERRAGRFFGSASEPDRGICAGYERIGDPLWDADTIARRLADQVPGGRDAVIGRFRFSVKAGGFGPPATKGRLAAPKELHADQRSRAETTRYLVDLDSAVLRPPEPGRYALRPSALIADELAPYMRAQQSVWAWWIAAQGWTVPPEFVAPLIEGEAVTVKTAARAATVAALPTASKRLQYLPTLVRFEDKRQGMASRELAMDFERLAKVSESQGKPIPGMPTERRYIVGQIEAIRRKREARAKREVLAGRK